LKRFIFKYVTERTRLGEVVNRPIVHVYIKSKDDKWYLFYPYVDSGADTSLFTKSDCELLGLDLYEGTYRSMAGIVRITIPTYLHKVLVRIGDTEFKATIAFADSDEVPRLIGRLDFFRRFKITFDEKELVTIFEAP